MPGSSSPRTLLIGLLLAALAAACASSGPRPGTGDLSFRLRWEGTADLDLHVEDPRGGHTGVVLPFELLDEEERQKAIAPQELREEEENAGILDVDCNSSPDQICERPIENVYWPAGTAPAGAYRARVVLFQKLYSDEEIRFVLEIREGEDVVRSVRGRVGDRERVSDWILFEH